MRTATPLATWLRITEYGPSATSEAISTPRFIGPGCMMMTSGLARRTRSMVIPKIVKYSCSEGKKWPCIRSSWDAQHHDDIGAVHGLIDGGRCPYTEPVDGRRHHRGWATDPNVGAKGCQKKQVRAQDAAVQEVTDDRHFQPLDSTLVLSDGQRIEERLGRMLMHPVAGVDDPSATDPSQQVTRSGRSVAKHDHVPEP